MSINIVSSPVWYILRSFNCQELKVSQFLTEKGKRHFIPMMYVEKSDRKGHSRRVLAPVVHNLIFLEKDDSQHNLMQMLNECPVTCYALRKEDSFEWCEVPDREMIEFRALCDPNFSDTHIMTRDDADVLSTVLSQA